MDVCSVCCEEYNDITYRYKINCSKCNYECCNECYINYFSQENTEKICCMSCKIEWGRLVQENKFKSRDIEKIQNIKKNKLFMLENGYMADTTKYVKNINEILDRRNQMSKLNRLTNRKKHDERNKKYEDRIKKLEHYATLETITKINYIMKCPCKCGGIITENYMCNLCDTKICRKCGEEKEENHKCDINNILNFNDIMINTKPCPKCYCRIHKVDGCDQMFCTHCKTGFSWKTGKIETHNLHNPHYFEYLRNAGQDHNDCGEFLYFLLPDVFSRSIYEKMRHYIRNENIQIDEYNENTNKDLRIILMQNYISQEDFKDHIIKSFNKIEIKNEYSQIINTFSVIIESILNMYIKKENTTKQVIDKINETVSYINESINKLKNICPNYTLSFEIIDMKF